MRNPARQSGIALVWATLLLAVLLTIVGLAIDTWYAALIAEKAQVAADASALAAAQAMSCCGPDESRSRARALASLNAPRGLQINLHDSDIVFGIWDKATASFAGVDSKNIGRSNAVNVTVRFTREDENAVPLFFGPIVGVNSATITRSAIAHFGQTTYWDIVIVQDRTGSFQEEIEDAKAADLAMVDCVMSHPDTQSRVGIVTFNGNAQVRSGLVGVSSKSSLKNVIQRIRTCDKQAPSCSGTNIAAGLNAAIGLFPPTASGRNPAIILVSDGRPEISSAAVSAKYYSRKTTNATLGRWAIQAADLAASRKIPVFTIFFNRDRDLSEQQFLASLARLGGIALASPKASELPQLMAAICSKLRGSVYLLE